MESLFIEKKIELQSKRGFKREQKVKKIEPQSKRSFKREQKVKKIEPQSKRSFKREQKVKIIACKLISAVFTYKHVHRRLQLYPHL